MTVFLTFQMVILWYNMSVCFLLKQTKEEKMTKEQEFLKEFEAWVNTQIKVNEMAVEESRRVLEEDKDERAADAYIRYESKLDAYRFIQGKFANYHADKGFHDLPDELLGQRHY
jgi:aldose 1-epimerase